MEFHKIVVPRTKIQAITDMKKTFMIQPGQGCEVGDIVCFISPADTATSGDMKALSDALYEIVYIEDTNHADRIAEFRRIK